MIRLLCCCLFVPLLTTTAFIPVLPHSNKQVLSLTLSRATTPPTKETLTEVEEEILFGDDTAMSDYRRSTDVFGNVLNNYNHNHNNNNNNKNNNPQPRQDPVVAKLQTIRESISSCPALWSALAQVVPEYRAVFDERWTEPAVDCNFQQMAAFVQKSAAVFQQCGIRKHDKVAFLAENAAHWLIADQGLQLLGGVSAVRGADAPLEELQYIYEHSDSKQLAVLQGPKLFKALMKFSTPNKPLGLWNQAHGPVKTILLLHREKHSDDEIQQLAQQAGVEVYFFPDLLAKTDPLMQLPTVKRDDLATIVYTSGTTGHPKGVMLSHGNLLHQTSHRLSQSPSQEPFPGDCMLSLLPIWHITERSFELWMASRGCAIVYSSIRTFKQDLAQHQPQWLVLVPRVLEKIALGVQDKFSSGSVAVKVLSQFFTHVSKTFHRHEARLRGLVVGEETPGVLEQLASRLIVTFLKPLQAVGNKLVWSKVLDGFGGRVKTVISGGSALAGSLEEFYQAAGMTVCVGYGLTECAPLLSYRRSDANLVTAGCAGHPCQYTEIQIVDPDTKKPVKIGEPGIIWGRGPQIMRGYYKNPEATAAVLNEKGWFDTGDLGRINPATGDLILTGRAKDTIVLSNGENIEPTPIEDAILGQCELIDQIMLTGQDGRRVVAVVVLKPSALSDYTSESESLQKQADRVNDPKCSPEDAAEALEILNRASEKLVNNRELKQRILSDIQKVTSKKFRKWEQVGDVHLTLEPFAMVNGLLTQSYKVKRNVVQDKYKAVFVESK
ncbi:long-chain acyl-CoA synthetase [Fistulifera solaris]|uniref:Long-chain acyl-CoA synthetase n=1 Tax=Fistulifera solaris TaxID=1519565 RepID=A0A1Z5KCI0_FISSO|nr:long-chain acyl-CoA synthetase [Fistulifera solaris]|eukprot:GAX24010.1 long-chain acyl-CoA synthetase [Fistulifera solaris]